jgi:hypothetical protein
MEKVAWIAHTTQLETSWKTTVKKHLLAVTLVMLLPLLPACAGTQVAGDNESLSNKWRIEVSEGAKSTGNMLFRITPEDQPAIDVYVGVTEGARENKVASIIRDAFRVQLPGDAYKVEKDDGEDVLVKARGDTPRFALALLSNNVKSVRIRLDKE